VAVIAREDRPGSKRLVAYVVGDADLDALRAHAATLLPDYMVPAAFVPMTALALTPNGKLDRRALPAPESGAASTGRAPSTPTEHALAQIIAELLGLPAVGVDDSFFDLGGDSIVSIQLVSRAKQAGIGISPRDVFERRTVARLAEIAGGVTAFVAEEPDAGIGEVTPLPIARWLLTEGGQVDGFHQSMLLTVPADLDLDRLVRALNTVLDHHDALRMRVNRDGVAIMPRGSVSARDCLHRVDLSTVDDLADLLAAQTQRASGELDPARGAMVRAVWFDAGRQRQGRLLLVLHHLVVDGVSWRILLPDLAMAAQAVELPPVGTSYRTWGSRLVEAAAERTGELAVWTAQLDNADPPLTDRPLDRAVDIAATSASFTITLPSQETEALITDVPAAFHAGVNEVLLTGLALAVADWRGGDGSAVTVEVEGHGREDIVAGTDISRTVGWFTSTYPVRLDPGVTDWTDLWAAGESATTALKRVKEALRALPDNGIGFGLLRYLNADTATTLAALPRPQIGFNYLGRFATPSAPADWQQAVEGVGLGGGADPGMCLPHSIEITAVTSDGPAGPRLSVTWLWPNGLLTPDRVRALADRFTSALRVLIECARHGDAGMTPSDLTLVDLSQDDIDEFEDDLREEWEMSR
jgi:non-ribosomal peptide synthase protein (TIGR01720 family)